MASRSYLRGFRMDQEKTKKQTSMLRFIRQSQKPQANPASKVSPNTESHSSQQDADSSTPEISKTSSPILKSINCERKYLLVSGSPDVSPATPVLKTFNTIPFTTPTNRAVIIKGSSSTSPNQLDSQTPPFTVTSKLFYVKPLSDDEVDMEESRPNAKESGFDITSVLKDKSQSSVNGTHSDDSDHTDNSNDLSQESVVKKNNFCKRLRIESDDEENHSRVLKKACLSDDSCDSPPLSHKTSTTKYSPEMIEKLLDTYSDLYPTVERMALFETMERWNYNFSEMTKCLDKFVKDQKKSSRVRMKANESIEKKQAKIAKIEDKEREIEEKRRIRIEEREKQKRKRVTELQRKKIIWKIKARMHNQENEDEDEEEDYIGKEKVYESDSSEGGTDYMEEDDMAVVTPARAMVLEFFNEGSLPELSNLPGCSKKKAEVIIQSRPFVNWRDLVFKFKMERYISTDLLNSAKDVLQMRTSVKNLMKKCERISTEIQSFVTDVISSEETAMNKQPEIMNSEMKLKHYQLIGLNWLVLMNDQQLNGVLADEMGLGKTVQAISFIAYLMEKGQLDGKMCLIVVPTSTLDNWARELSVWVPSIGFLVYHGSQEERRGMRMDILNNDLDENVCIILTTYNMVSSSTEDKALFKRIPLHTIIYDEAHMLKNMTSQRYENLMKIKGIRRLLLTGTPLQNNLLELMSILIFVMPQLFEGRKEELKKVFSMFPKNEGDGSKGRYERERVQQAKRIMAPFFLRRLKCDVLKDLPEKRDFVFFVSMIEKQEAMYKSTVQVLSKRAEEMKRELEKMKLQDLDELADLQSTSASPLKSPQAKNQTAEDSSSNMLMKLRKLANHPLLIRSLYTDEKIKEMSKILKKSTHKDSVLDYIIEDFSVMSDFEIHQTCVSLAPISHFQLTSEVICSSGKMRRLDELLPDMKKNGDRVLIFSQFVIVLNILEEYLKARGYQYRRLDGSTQVADRQEMIDDFNEDDRIFIFLLSTRAGGLGINLSSANTVILHDIDFNPYNDKQAEDRCHRVGQTRDVKVYRFICKNSIEEGMHQIAIAKLQLEKDITGKTENDHRKGDVVALLKTALRVDNPE